MPPTAVTPVFWRWKQQDGGWGSTRLALAPQRDPVSKQSVLACSPQCWALDSLVCHSEPLLFCQGHTLQLYQTTGLRCAQGRPHKASTLTRPAFYNAGWDWTDLTDDPTPHQGWACCWSGELGLTSQVGCVACAWPLREPPPSTSQRGGQGQHGTEIPQDRA